MLCFDKSENITGILGSKLPRLRTVTMKIARCTQREGFLRIQAHMTLDRISYTLTLLTVGNIYEVIRGFPGGTLDKNPPANAGDTGSIPGPGRSYVLQQPPQPTSLELCSASGAAPQWQAHVLQGSPAQHNQRAHTQRQRPSTTKAKKS